MENLPCERCLSDDQSEELEAAMIYGIEDEENTSPIICAAHTGHVECLEQLLITLNVKKTSSGLAAAVCEAVMKGHINCTKSLIKAGADLNMYTENYCMEDYKDSAQGLVPSGNLKDRHERCIKLVIEAGLDVNSNKQSENDLLSNAIENEHVNCLKLLINANADVNLWADGESLLALAVAEGSEQVVKILVESGADVNYVDSNGMTPLMDMFERMNPNATYTQLFLQEGADVNHVDKTGRSAIHYAIRTMSYPCIAMLLEAGCDVNATDEDDNTPLILAAGVRFGEKQERMQRVADIIKLLLKYGAHINKVNEFNALDQCLLFNGTKFMEPALLLYAAGEKLHDTTKCEIEARYGKLPDCILNIEEDRSLKHISRTAIRKHLMNIDPQLNLLYRVSQLDLQLLPSLVRDYLLFDMSPDTPPDDRSYDDNPSEECPWD